jgi:hypothetical protein
MDQTKKSRLFFKARERVIDEIATRMICERIEDGDDEHHGIRIPQTWLQEADKRVNELIGELSDESLREDEESRGVWAASPTTKAKKVDRD